MSRISPSRTRRTRRSMHIRRDLFVRWRAALAFGLMALFLLAPFPLDASAQGEGAATDEEAIRFAEAAARAKEPEFVPGEVLVLFRESSPLAKNQARLETVLRGLDRDIPARVERFAGAEIVSGLRLARVAPAETLATIAALNQRPDVLYAEPNYLLRPAQASVLPNDPRFPEMYGLRNTGQVGFNDYIGQQASGTPDADIDADLAWGITTGSSDVVVGVIDTGIDINHPDLRDNIWVNPGEIAGDGIDNDGNGRIDDVNGWDFSAPSGGDASVFDNPTIDDHGTHVAGTIGASGNNGVGVTGINWRVKIMPLKFIGGTSGSTANAAAAINYAIAMRQRGVNIRVLNNSWGGSGQSQTLVNAINAANNAGILFVASAGNDSTNNDDFPHFPSSHIAPNVVPVAATDRFDQLARLSNFGPRGVLVAAPGRGILSTTPRSLPGTPYPATYTDPDGSTYSFFSGTSMAAPHVTGVAALILSQYPTISVQRLRAALMFSGDSLSNSTFSGRTFGARRLNAYQALLNAALNDTTPPAISGLFIAAQNGRSVTAQFQAGDDGLSGSPALYVLTFHGADGSNYHLSSVVPSSAPGTAQTVTAQIPPRYMAGTLRVRAIDKAGNEATADVGVAVNADAADPYVVNLSAVSALSTGGTGLALRGDDRYLRNYELNFNFPYFGQTMTHVTVSINGALYFSPPPVRSAPTDSPQETANDPQGTLAGLNNQNMIAGMWDDLRTDRTDGDVYVVRPDANRVIFRWQGVTFTGELPVNFEIELRSDGTIIKRYGSGNTGLRSVVGISGGHADTQSGGQSSYWVPSHTSSTSTLSLTNAQTITYSPRGATPPPPPPPVVGFVSPTYTVGEDAGSITLRVSRSGDTSITVTVDYATSDSNGSTRCDVATGWASVRCDYAIALGRLTFAPGETDKTISIQIFDDALVEGAEVFNVSLGNLSAGNLGVVPSASITIQDNDTNAAAPNPIEDVSFFVRQQYRDFLNREPEQQGWNDWMAVINRCQGEPRCVENARVVTSASFFLSPEFQATGYFVYRLYRTSLGRTSPPSFSDYIRDSRQLDYGVSGDRLEATKQAFAQQWVARPEFLGLYPATISHQEFINRLTQRVSSAVGAQLTSAEQQQLVNELNAGSLTRAQAVIRVADHAEVVARLRNEAFVAMQYYGYLRREPEAGGLQDWLRVLNNNPEDYWIMVWGFIYSPEYQARFGVPR